MEDYKPNSHRYKDEQKQSNDERREIKKVVSGTIKTKKKSGIRKLTDVFVSEDASNVKSYVLMDVLVPALKKAIDDIVSDGIHMVLYGSSGRGKRRPVDSVSYTNYSSKRDERRYSEPRSRTGFDYDDIVFDSRGEAEKVLVAMDSIMEDYKMVRVADMYDLAGITSPYTANDYGWTNIRNAKIERIREGYIIKMPRAIPIK